MPAPSRDNQRLPAGERPGPELVLFSRSMLELLTHLHALMFGYHVAHVNVRGANYYGDHLLLQRLYKGDDESDGGTPLDEIDAVMEKWKGLMGPDAHLDAAMIAKEAALILGRAHMLSGDKLLRWFHSTEHDLQYLIKEILEKQAPPAIGYESEGLSNLLQGIADRRQTNIYLLQQRLAGGPGAVSGYLQAEAGIWDDEDHSPPRGDYKEATPF